MGWQSAFANVSAAEFLGPVRRDQWDQALQGRGEGGVDEQMGLGGVAEQDVARLGHLFMSTAMRNRRPNG